MGIYFTNLLASRSGVFVGPGVSLSSTSNKKQGKQERRESGHCNEVSQGVATASSP